jgi:hypothetical protein
MTAAGTGVPSVVARDLKTALRKAVAMARTMALWTASEKAGQRDSSRARSRVD